LNIFYNEEIGILRKSCGIDLVAIDYLEFDGMTIEIERKRIKNLHLRIYPPAGQVRISAPLRLSMHSIGQQLEAKRDWIHKQRARIQALPVRSEPTMQTGELHFFLGQALVLNIYETATAARINREDNVLQVYVKPNTTALEKYNLLQRWYRKEMEALLPDLITKWQAIIRVHVAEWGIKVMKTRWGSCNIRAHRIWLNLTLIKKPIACLESVLVHEMVHLLEKNHNARFYSLMDKFMPEWRDVQLGLNG